MIRSMTGYGQGTAECSRLRVTVELRGVNNRYAEVRLRLPADLMHLESALRRKVLGIIRRGRVDLNLSLDRTGDRPRSLVINGALIEELKRATDELRERSGVAGSLDLATLLNLPGVLELREEPAGWGEEEQAALDEALDAALSALDGERRREGETLARELAERFAAMEALVAAISERAHKLPSELHRKLLERLEVLSKSVELDPSRVAQEAAFLADRADVTEELVRLRAHVEQGRALIETPDGDPLGKRLDFLLQEIHRETNTVNGKSSDLELTRHALDLKAEGEKVREQIQNLE